MVEPLLLAMDQLIDGKQPEQLIELPPSTICYRQSLPAPDDNQQSNNRIIAAIRQHACHGISVAALAQELGMSTRSLQLQCQRELNSSPSALLIAQRINRAKQLIRENKLSMNAIARACGFS